MPSACWSGCVRAADRRPGRASGCCCCSAAPWSPTCATATARASSRRPSSAACSSLAFLARPVPAMTSSDEHRPFPSSSSAPARPGSPPPPCSASTASSAWSSTAGRGSTRSRGRSHLDDEIYRILARLGHRRAVRRRLAAHPRAAADRPEPPGLRRVPPRPATTAGTGYPQANMFDQPELEHLLRTNLKDQADGQPPRQRRGHRRRPGRRGPGAGRRHRPAHRRARVPPGQLRAGLRRRQQPGPDGHRLRPCRTCTFEQRWLVIDIATDADLDQWEGVHQVCDPHRAATYMRIGDDPLPLGVPAAAGRDRGRLRDHRRPAAADRPVGRAASPASGCELVRVAEYTFRAQLADRWRDRNVFLLGDAAHLTPPFIGAGAWAPDCATR